MSNSKRVVSFPAIRELEAEAVAWIVKLDSGDMSEREREEFNTWKGSSHHHREALQRATTFWGGLDCLREFEVLAKENVPQRIRPLDAVSGWISRTGWFDVKTPFVAGALAMSLLVASLVAMRVLFPESNSSHLYSTEVGMQQTIELADNSSILLNTDSVVEVSYTNEQRGIRLIRGEAHFEVAKDPARPFVVSARDMAVAAVGTAFSVRLYETKLEVTVTEGKVRVEPVEVATTPTQVEVTTADSADTASKPALILAGQNAVFSQVVELIEEIPIVELNRKLAWHQGMLVFDGEPLEQVVENIARYTDLTITIDDASIRELPVVGLFKVGEIEALFEALEQSLGLQISTLDSDRVVISEQASHHL